MPYYYSLKCDKCGKFMAKDGDEWMERESIYDPPLSPYVNQNWKCKCGNTRITTWHQGYPIDVEIRSSEGRKHE